MIASMYWKFVFIYIYWRYWVTLPKSWHPIFISNSFIFGCSEVSRTLRCCHSIHSRYCIVLTKWARHWHFSQSVSFSLYKISLVCVFVNIDCYCGLIRSVIVIVLNTSLWAVMYELWIVLMWNAYQYIA